MNIRDFIDGLEVNGCTVRPMGDQTIDVSWSVRLPRVLVGHSAESLDATENPWDPVSHTVGVRVPVGEIEFAMFDPVEATLRRLAYMWPASLAAVGPMWRHR